MSVTDPFSNIPVDQRDREVYVIRDFENHRKGEVIMVKARRYPYLIKDGSVVPHVSRKEERQPVVTKEEKAVIETKQEKVVLETKEEKPAVKEVKPRKPRAKKA